MATKGEIAIMVRGGLIQCIAASKDIADLLTIEVYDLDEPGFMTDGEKGEIEDKENKWDAIVADENMICVY
jgi:hypothetical protein